MKLHITAVALSLLMLPGPLFGQWILGIDKKTKQDAKDLFDKATKETDIEQKTIDTCRASQMDRKNKKYTEECTKLKGTQTQSDSANLQAAKDALAAGHIEVAEVKAKAVSQGNDKLRGDVVEVLRQIADERYRIQIQDTWNQGDFEAVKDIAAKSVDPNQLVLAKNFLGYIERYDQYVDTARRLEASDPKGAVEAYRAAGHLNLRGPVDTVAKIAMIESAVRESQEKAATTTRLTTPKAPPKPGSEALLGANKIATLLADAKSTEKAGKPAEAFEEYQAVLSTQPGNAAATAGVARLQPILQAAARRAELREALRDVYALRLEAAEQKLRRYLGAPAPQDLGPAAFYLGVVVLERSVLNTPQANWQGPPLEAQKYFRQARAANYNPSRKYVSPVLLKVWDTIGP